MHAPPLETPGFGAAKPARVPALGAAFRPRDRRICGKIKEFQLGNRRISMPVTYPCESRQEEFRRAPGNSLRP